MSNWGRKSLTATGGRRGGGQDGRMEDVILEHDYPGQRWRAWKMYNGCTITCVYKRPRVLRYA